MKKNSRKYNLLIVIIVYAAIFSSAVYFLAIPFAQDIKFLSDQIQSKIIDQQINQSRLNKLPQMEDDWSYYKSNENSLDVILRSENQLEFIENIEAIAGKTNNIISLQIKEYPDPKESKRMKEESDKTAKENKSILGNISVDSYFPMQIELKGDYIGLVNFVNMLENSRIYVNIVSINAHKEEIKESNILQENVSKEENKPKEKEILSSIIKAVVYVKQ